MATFQQTLIQPACLPGSDPRRVRLTRDDLQRLRENTLGLIQQGATIPLLLGHAAAGAVDGGPITSFDRARDRRAAGVPAAARFSRPVGHLVDLVELPDGSLWQAIEINDDTLGRLRAAGAAPRFTSPEIRPFFSDGICQRPGPLIAHLALTDSPLCPGQTLLAPCC